MFKERSYSNRMEMRQALAKPPTAKAMSIKTNDAYLFRLPANMTIGGNCLFEPESVKRAGVSQMFISRRQPGAPQPTARSAP